MELMTFKLVFCLFAILAGGNSETSRFLAPLNITLNQVLGMITIRDIMEISFDLQIHNINLCEQGPWCHIFSIQDRYPLIYTYKSGLFFEYQYSHSLVNPDLNIVYPQRYSNSNSSASNGYTLIKDSRIHRFYMKFSAYERIIIIDDIVVNNSYGSVYNDAISQTKDITAVWGNLLGNQKVHSGTISNLSITSSDPTFNPTTSPTNVPTFNPTIFPTNVPTNVSTFNPTNVPTFNPSLYPSLHPTFNPTESPSYPTQFPSYPTSTPTSTLAPTISPVDSRENGIDTTQNEIVSTKAHVQRNASSHGGSFTVIVLVLSSFICVAFIIVYYLKRSKKQKHKLMQNYEPKGCDYVELIDQEYNSEDKCTQRDFNASVTPSGTTRTAGESVSLQSMHKTSVIGTKMDSEVLNQIEGNVANIGGGNINSDDDSNDEIIQGKNTAGSFNQILNDNVVGVDFLMDEIVHHMDTEK
eukprot:317247_1